jgi:hypothetical protein
MHDVVLLYRCYPSTPHGVGPWLPAPSSAPQPELPHWFASLGAQAFTCLACHGSGEYDLGMCDACWVTEPTVVYDATGHDQRGRCGPSCNCPF